MQGIIVLAMLDLTKLPETIPIFPLSGATLFPHCLLPLNIFEPRYVAMVSDALEQELSLIGMVQPESRSGDEIELYGVGCAGLVSGCRKTDDGRFEIILLGVSRFRLQTVAKSAAPYLMATVDWSDFSQDMRVEDDPPEFDHEGFGKIVKEFFASRGISVKLNPVEGRGVFFLVNEISMSADLAPEEKQALLEIPHLQERCRALEFLLRMDMSCGKEMTTQ